MTWVICPRCNGLKVLDCEVCATTGKILDWEGEEMDCTECEDGYVDCDWCHGTGQVDEIFDDAPDPYNW